MRSIVVIALAFSIFGKGFAQENTETFLFWKKIKNGYLPVSVFDFDLRTLAKFNNYEGFRFGVGGTTNTRLSEKFKIGAYGAYGLKDREMKFGITPSFRLFKTSETWISGNFIDDLSEIALPVFWLDPARHRIYDPRPFAVFTFYQYKQIGGTLKTKFSPKTVTAFSITNQQVVPQFNYAYQNNNDLYTQYRISNFQFAFQYNADTKTTVKPKHYLQKISFQYTQGLRYFLDGDFNFSKFDCKAGYKIPIHGKLNTNILFMGGLALGDIPLTHLYGMLPNNLDRDAILQRFVFAGANSFETMYYNEFFSDKYLALHLKQPLFYLPQGKWFSPSLSIVSRMTVGTLNNPEKHHTFAFKTLEKGFFESGMEFNGILKGLGISVFYRHGAQHLPHLSDNIALKVLFSQEF